MQFQRQLGDHLPQRRPGGPLCGELGPASVSFPAEGHHAGQPPLSSAELMAFYQTTAERLFGL
jgi:hypothetical protein